MTFRVRSKNFTKFSFVSFYNSIFQLPERVFANFNNKISRRLLTIIKKKKKYKIRNRIRILSRIIIVPLLDFYIHKNWEFNLILEKVTGNWIPIGIRIKSGIVLFKLCNGTYIKWKDKGWHLIKEIVYWKHYRAEYFSRKRLTISASIQIDIAHDFISMRCTFPK